MTPQEREKSDRKVLMMVAGLVVAGVAALVLVAGLGSQDGATARPVQVAVKATPVKSAPVETPAVFVPRDIPSEEKIPGSTIGPDVAESSPEFVIEAGANLVAGGLEHYGNRDFAYAAAFFQAQTEQAPGDAWSHYMLALSSWKAGSMDQAVQAMQESIELNAESIKSKINLSRIQNDRGAYGEALDAADAALELDAGSATALFLRGRSLRNLGRTDEAIAVLEESLAIMDNGHAANLLGLTFIEQAEFDAAREVLTRAASIEPDVAYIQNNLGMALERSGRRDEAIVAYGRAVELNPEHSRAAINLARLGQPAESTPFDTDPGTAVATVSADIEEVELAAATGEGPSR